MTIEGSRINEWFKKAYAREGSDWCTKKVLNRLVGQGTI